MSRILIESSKLKEFVRDLLTEEIVTIHRDSGDFVYDVEFSGIDDGNIKKGTIQIPIEISSTKIHRKKKIDTYDDITRIAKIFTTEPIHKIFNKIKYLQSIKKYEYSRKNPNSVYEIVKELNDNWKDALEWLPTNRKGKGEAAVHLAFNSNLNIAEPDFVSYDGKIALSIKYLGYNGSAHSSQSNQIIKSGIVSIKNLLQIPHEQNSVSAKIINSRLGDQSIDPNIKNQINLIVVDMIKSLPNEKNAVSGMLVIADGKVEHVSTDQALDKFKILNLKSDRIEFALKQSIPIGIDFTYIKKTIKPTSYIRKNSQNLDF